MKITALETIRIAERPNLIWVQVHTDQGLIGLGETFFGASTVEAHVHAYAPKPDAPSRRTRKQRKL